MVRWSGRWLGGGREILDGVSSAGETRREVGKLPGVAKKDCWSGMEGGVVDQEYVDSFRCSDETLTGWFADSRKSAVIMLQDAEQQAEDFTLQLDDALGPEEMFD